MWGVIRSAAAVALSAVLVHAVPARAQNAQVSTVAVEVFGDSDLRKDSDLLFGNLAPGTSGGTAIIAPNGAVSTTGSVVQAGGTTGAATFSFQRRFLRNDPNIVGPTGSDYVDLVNPSAPARPMRLRNFTNDYAPGGPLNGSRYIFHVGGTLDVAADQPGGLYTGSFTVTLDNF